MRVSILLFLVIQFIACSNIEKKEGSDISLKGIINANTLALGGTGKLDSVEAIKIISKKRETNYYDSIEFIADRKGRMRIDIYDLKMEGKDRVFAESFDGKNGHQWSPKKGQEPASEKGTIALAHTPQYPGHIFQLKDMNSSGHQLEFIEKEEINGVEYYVLRLTLSDGFKSYYYINSKTTLISKIRSKRALHVDVNPEEQLIEVQHLNHKTVEGIVKPFRVIETDLNKDTLLMESMISDYVFNLVMPDSSFTDLTKIYQ